MKRTGQQTKRLRISDLRKYSLLYDRLVGNKEETVRAHGLAIFVLRYYLGDEWVSRYGELRGGFLPAPADEQKANIHLIRVVQIAEMILNLRDVNGISAVIEQLKGGKIKSAYAELEVGKILITRGNTI